MPVDPGSQRATHKRKSGTSEQSSESLDQPLYTLIKKKRSRRLSSLLDREGIPQEGMNENEVPLAGSVDRGGPSRMDLLLSALDELRSQSPAKAMTGRDISSTAGASSLPPETEGTSQICRDELEDRFQGDLNCVRAYYEQMDELLATILEAQAVAKEELKKSEESARASMETREELEMVVRAQRTQIAELFASVNRKDAELAEVCVASWASKERIWELELDLKVKNSRLERASAEVKELRELDQTKKEASEEKLRDLSVEYAEEAFSACLDQIKDRYPELDLSFSDLGAALEARAAAKKAS